MSFSANLYMLKVNNGNIRTMCEIYSMLIIKTPERLFTAQKITFSIKIPADLVSFAKEIPKDKLYT